MWCFMKCLPLLGSSLSASRSHTLFYCKESKVSLPVSRVSVILQIIQWNPYYRYAVILYSNSLCRHSSFLVYIWRNIDVTNGNLQGHHSLVNRKKLDVLHGLEDLSFLQVRPIIQTMKSKSREMMTFNLCSKRSGV